MATTDVIVIGGGLLGWSAAYRLVRDGARVTVVDRADAGQATAAGAGIIAPGASFKYPDASIPLSQASVDYYPALLKELAEDGETDTGYETVGALFLAQNEGEAAHLPEALHIMRQRRDQGMGNIGDARIVDGHEAQSLFPPLAEFPAAIHIPEAARVNGRLMRDALRRAAEKRGVHLIHTSAEPVRDGGRVSAVKIDGDPRPVDAVVIAGGAWSSALGDALGLRLPVEPQRGQILHMEMPGTDTSRWPIILGHHGHYLLTFPTNRVVAGATREVGSGYDVRLTAGGTHEVLSEALRVAPGLAGATIAEWRVGLRPYSAADQLPILGRAPGYDNLYLATGHGPSGLQLGPVSGAIVADLIAGRGSRIDLTPYAADRFGERG
ncbi:MAG: NAD(P)/FAD-dependent oxidoreductase [Thermomicrobiales bacterium]